MILIVKSFIYRVLRVILLLIISYLVLGDIKDALSISFIDMAVATLYYFYFEKGWDKFGEPFFKEVLLRAKYWKLNIRK
jgi:uncharacterized membrane protein